jgi:glutathione S-transferase/GST-like protein
MLELYHWEPNAASARVLIALKEKGLPFESRYVDVLAFEQHAPDFIKLNETGETPVLVRDGETFTESSFICEYIDEAFDGASLMPASTYDRWKARNWQKYVDDHLAAAVGTLAWYALGAPQLRGRSRASVEAAIGRIPTKARQDVWLAAVDPYTDEQQAKDRGRVEAAVRLLEDELSGSDWLAGPAFSLADVAMFAFMNYLPRVTPDLVNVDKAPRTMAWLKRVGDRPGVKAALAMARTADPYAIAAPGPEHIRWG